MIVLPVIIWVVRVFQWSIQNWQPDEMGTFQTCRMSFCLRTFTGKRTKPETTPCLQKQTEEVWKKLKSTWIQQTDQREAWCKLLWCMCFFVCLCYRVFNGEQPYIRKNCKAEKDITGKEIEGEQRQSRTQVGKTARKEGR